MRSFKTVIILGAALAVSACGKTETAVDNTTVQINESEDTMTDNMSMENMATDAVNAADTATTNAVEGNAADAADTATNAATNAQ